MANPKARIIIHNKSERNDYITEYRAYKPIYISVYKFAQIKPSLYATHQHAIVDKMFLDIDDNEGIDPYFEMIRLHEYLMELNIIHRIHLSGRGFHIFFWINQNLNYPKLAIQNYWDFLHGPLKCYNCGHTLKNFICPSCHIKINYMNTFKPKKSYTSPTFNLCPSTRGDLGRIFRFPNTRNFKAACYAIVIDDYLLNKCKSLKEFQDYAVKPYKPRGKIYFGEKELDISEFDCPTEQYNQMNYTHLSINPVAYGHLDIDYDVEFDLKECPICIQNLVKQELHFRERNSLIKFLCNRLDIFFPYNPNQIMGILYKVSEHNPYLRNKFSERHIWQLRRNVMVIYDNEEIRSSCREMKGLGCCVKADCLWKNIKEK